MGNINKDLVPIKAHFFFFMAAMGPILPQLSVYGKELGISSVVMGSITGILPIMFLITKPIFGILVDVCRNQRKGIFIGLIVITSLFYAGLNFIPSRFIMTYHFRNASCSQLDTCNVTEYLEQSKCTSTRRVLCKQTCENGLNSSRILLGYVEETPKLTPQLTTKPTHSLCLINNNNNFSCSSSCDIKCEEDVDMNTGCLYQSITFWSFIVLMSLGTIGFNVVNSISDAICFDVIGDTHEYGKQRVWGTFGFGITALIAGYVVDFWSGGQVNYTPAFVVMLICTFLDVLACIKLKLPIMPAPSNIFKDLKELMNNRHTIIFIIFTTLAGVLDSLVVYFLFWYLEDLAIATKMSNIKLLEGLTVACQTLGAEVIFFYLSGKILQRLGHAYCFSMCFLFYGLRFALISLIPTPWWILPIEFIFQGPTYALIYTTIVAYANDIAPPGLSATMQGIAAGMDDGFGYALGSIIGGFLYKYVGGKGALQVFSLISIICGVTHFILYKTMLQHHKDPASNKQVEYMTPEDAAIAVSNNEEKHILSNQIKI